MDRLKSISAFRTVLIVSGVFDLIGVIYFTLLVGSDRSITNPPTDSFYAILIGSFLFCFAYLQFITAIRVKHYLSNIGVVILSRIFYAVLFFSFLLFVEEFPTTFLPTAITDLAWVVFYFMLALVNDEVRLRDLFIPE